jgi:hypothetical protein
MKEREKETKIKTEVVTLRHAIYKLVRAKTVVVIDSFKMTTPRFVLAALLARNFFFFFF